MRSDIPGYIAVGALEESTYVTLQFFMPTLCLQNDVVQSRRNFAPIQASNLIEPTLDMTSNLILLSQHQCVRSPERLSSLPPLHAREENRNSHLPWVSWWMEVNPQRHSES